jgi:Phosphatidylinositol 3- and 4-kinase
MNLGLLNILNRSATQVGHSLVLPGFHADPSFLSDAAKDSASLFSSRMLNHQYHPSLRPLEMAENGATEKVHFHVGGHRDADGKVQPSATFMVKPYYEDMQTNQYGHYPLAGWAEMAWHGILNAADMGHTAMRVHTFPYHDSALLAVELEPGLTHAFNAAAVGPLWNPELGYGRVAFPSNIKDDASKLGALDFLLNNQDRNASNLMLKINHQGEANSLLAIDHGRSMQYMEAHRSKAQYSNVDNVFNYLGTPAYRDLLSGSLHQPLKAISQWWHKNKPKIVGEFHRHLSGIRHPELATHIGSSFGDRVKALDNLTEDFAKHGPKPYEEYANHNVDGKNASLVSRAGVKVRSWSPQNDPLPFQSDNDGDYHTSSCPTCGEDF